MLARVQSYLLRGIDALPCEVEVDLDDHAQAAEEERHVVVGLPDSAVRESLQRVRAAITNTGYFRPPGRLLINLAPAHLRKEGPLYDLPIAIALLQAVGVVPTTERAAKEELPDLRSFLIAGELALDGRVRPVRGVIAMAALARGRGATGVIVPAANGPEAAVVDGVNVVGVGSLSEVVGILNGNLDVEPHPPMDVENAIASSQTSVDFIDVRGQEAVKRAIVIAAAGGHNLLMLGPAGTGKTMMSRALPGVLPALTAEEAIEVTRIYSAAGLLAEGCGLVTVRPVRSPHHTASAPAVVGGGQIPRPGEISLAHRGVLFMDELPEFPRAVLETLRQPLEDHVVTIARAHTTLTYPASFMLVAAMNPTPKGDMATDEVSKREMDRYLSRLSAPLIDRIDIHVEAPAVPWKELSSRPKGRSSGDMRTEVLRARQLQTARQNQTANSRLTGRQLDELAQVDEESKTLLGRALTELGLSARAYDKIRRIARTIADLDGSEGVRSPHVAEAVGYRLLDRRV